MLGCVTRLHPAHCSGTGSVQTNYDLQSISSPSTQMQISRSEGVEPLSKHEARHPLHHAIRLCSIDISSDRNSHLITVFPTETCIFRVCCRHYGSSRLPITYPHLFLFNFWLSYPSFEIHRDPASLEALAIGDAGDLTADESLPLAETIRSYTQLKHLGYNGKHRTTSPTSQIGVW